MHRTGPNVGFRFRGRLGIPGAVGMGLWLASCAASLGDESRPPSTEAETREIMTSWEKLPIIPVCVLPTGTTELLKIKSIAAVTSRTSKPEKPMVNLVTKFQGKDSQISTLPLVVYNKGRDYPNFINLGDITSPVFLKTKYDIPFYSGEKSKKTIGSIPKDTILIARKKIKYENQPRLSVYNPENEEILYTPYKQQDYESISALSVKCNSRPESPNDFLWFRGAPRLPNLEVAVHDGVIETGSNPVLRLATADDTLRALGKSIGVSAEAPTQESPPPLQQAVPQQAVPMTAPTPALTKTISVTVDVQLPYSKVVEALALPPCGKTAGENARMVVFTCPVSSTSATLEIRNSDLRYSQTISFDLSSPEPDERTLLANDFLSRVKLKFKDPQTNFPDFEKYYNIKNIVSASDPLIEVRYGTDLGKILFKARHEKADNCDISPRFDATTNEIDLSEITPPCLFLATPKGPKLQSVLGPNCQVLDDTLAVCRPGALSRGEVEIQWRDGWTASITPNPKAVALTVQSKDLRARWPFGNTSYTPLPPSISTCAAPPSATGPLTVRKVRYCWERGCSETWHTVSNTQAPIQMPVAGVPPAGPASSPLPIRVEARLESESGAGGEAQWLMNHDTYDRPPDLGAVAKLDKQAPQTFPLEVAILPGTILKTDPSSDLLFFDSKDRCEQKTESVSKVTFDQPSYRSYKVEACQWAKVVYGRENSSYCAQGQHSGAAGGVGSVRFELRGTSINAKRHIIMVEDSRSLLSHRRAALDAIQDRLTSPRAGGLTDSRPALTVVRFSAINEEVTRSENLDAPDGGAERVRKSLDDMGFDGTGGDSLVATIRLHDYYRDNIKSLLLITAGRLPSDINLDESKAILYLRNQQVPISVVTGGPCEPWIKLGTSCHPIVDLASAMSQFAREQYR